MVVMKRSKRLELIEQDDGDLADDVHISTGTGTQHRSYHDDSDCSRIRSSKTNTMERGEAQRRLKPPCRVCVLGLKLGGVRKDPELANMSRLEYMVKNGEVDDEHLGSPIGGD